MAARSRPKPSRACCSPISCATNSALTGTHVGCEHGVCGACTVQIDGAPARACLTLAVQADGSDIRTVEGLAPEPGRLSALQEAFRRHHALQCGFCTAGILMSLDMLSARQSVSRPRRNCANYVSGHLCRCTGYVPIIAAALDAAALLREAAHACLILAPASSPASRAIRGAGHRRWRRAADLRRVVPADLALSWRASTSSG